MNFANELSRIAKCVKTVFLLAMLLTASAVACPDLVPASFELSGNPTVFPNTSVETRLSASVANVGQSAATGFQIGFFIAADTSVGSEHQPLTGGPEFVDFLDTGQVLDIEFANSKTIPADWPLGPAYLGIMVDSGDDLDECIENNNAAFIPIEVVEEPQSQDTIFTIDYMQSGEYYPLPVAGEDYDAIGMRYTNSSVLDTIELQQFGILLFKTPGQPCDTAAGLVVAINRVDQSLQPGDTLFIDTIPGYLIASDWPKEDSLKWLQIPLVEKSSHAATPIGPAEEWLVSLAPTDLSHVACAASDRQFDVSNLPSTPCFEFYDPAWRSQLERDFGGGSTNWEASPVPFHSEFSVQAIPQSMLALFADVSFDHWDHFVNNWPETVNNCLSLTLNSLWVDRLHFAYSEALNNITLQIDDDVYSVTPYDNWYSETGTSVCFPDMESLPEGNHPVRLRLNGAEYWSGCFYTEDRPLVDAPWAAITTHYDNLEGSNDLYKITAKVPKVEIGFDKPVTILGKTYQNYLTMNVGFRQDFHNHGDWEITKTDDEIALVIMGKPLFSRPINFVPDEPEVDYLQTVFTLDFPSATLWQEDWELFNGTLLDAQLVPGILDIKVTGKFGLKGRVDLEAEFSTSPEDYGSLTITPSVTPYAEITARLDLLMCLKLAEASLRGEFEMSFPITMSVDHNFIPQVSACFDLDVVASYSYWLPFKTHTGSKRFNLYEDCVGKGKDDYELRWTTGGFHYETPELARTADGMNLAAAWSHHTDGIEDQIFFSKKENEEWSSPEPVTATETGKFDADICSFGESSWAAVWTEFDGEQDTLDFNEDSLFASIQRQEIAVSTYDTSTGLWSAPQRLTNDDRGDGRPVLAGCEDRVYAVWVKHMATTEYDPSKMRIVCRAYDATGSGTWLPPEVLPGQAGYNLQPVVEVDPLTGEAVIVWVQDQDGNVYTYSDRYLRSVRIGKDGKVVPGSLQTVPSMVGPAAPAVIVTDEALLVAYESWGYLEDSTGNVTDTVGLGDNIKIGSSIFKEGTWKIRPVGDYLTTGYGMNPELALDQSGLAHLVYRAFEKGDPGLLRGEITHATLNMAESNLYWSETVRLTESDMITYMGDVTTDALGQAEILYLRDEFGQEFPYGFDKIYELTVNVDNTPMGQDVDFTLPDGTRLQFDEVTSPGYTSGYGDDSGPDVPSPWAPVVSGDNVYHYAMTTAGYTGHISVGIDYSEEDLFGSEANLRMLQWNGSGWSDVTKSVDVDANSVTGLTEELSIFVLTLPADYTCGDADGSGGADIDDVVFEIAYIFTGGPAPDPLAAGDADCSGALDIDDVVYLIGYIFTGGPEPCATCGEAKAAAKEQVGSADLTLVSEETDGQNRLAISLQSDYEVQALQFDFDLPSGISDPKVESSLDGLGLFYGSTEDHLRIGLLDLYGKAMIPADRSEILTITYSGDEELKLTDQILVARGGGKLDAIVKVAGSQQTTPRGFDLNQSYPNPCNPTTNISFSLPSASKVRLDVYNVLGQRVRTLVDGFLPAGDHSVIWDGRTDNGEVSASGVYFYRMEAGTFSDTKKMMLLK